MPQKYAMVIVNPVAGRGATGKRWPAIKECLKNTGLSYEFALTSQKGHAIEIANEAVNNGYEFIIAVGGDGTVNEVANGILTSPKRKQATLGVINTGTGSDYVRTLGTPKDPILACDFLKREDRFLIDVGLVEYVDGDETRQRFFVNYAGTGFDSEVSERTNRMAKVRFITKSAPYVLSLLVTLVRYKNKTVNLTIDDNKRTTRVLSVVVANGRYIGGGMKIAPDAELSDGKLDVVAINDVSKCELLQTFPKIYSGTHVTHPKVSVCSAEYAEVDPIEKMPLSADGELLGHSPAKFFIIPQALAVAR